MSYVEREIVRVGKVSEGEMSTENVKIVKIIVTRKNSDTHRT